MDLTAQEKKIDIKSTIKQFIVDNFLFGSDSDTFCDKESFIEKGIMDSTGILELIAFIEDKYTIKIEDDEMLPENLDSIDNIFAYIKRKKGNLGQ